MKKARQMTSRPSFPERAQDIQAHNAPAAISKKANHDLGFLDARAKFSKMDTLLRPLYICVLHSPPMRNLRW